MVNDSDRLSEGHVLYCHFITRIILFNKGLYYSVRDRFASWDTSEACCTTPSSQRIALYPHLLFDHVVLQAELSITECSEMGAHSRCCDTIQDSSCPDPSHESIIGKHVLDPYHRAIARLLRPRVVCFAIRTTMYELVSSALRCESAMSVAAEGGRAVRSGGSGARGGG
ncbi:jg25772, partial [Pararge aegeria aegeria]